MNKIRCFAAPYDDERLVKNIFLLWSRIVTHSLVYIKDGLDVIFMTNKQKKVKSEKLYFSFNYLSVIIIL